MEALALFLPTKIYAIQYFYVSEYFYCLATVLMAISIGKKVPVMDLWEDRYFDLWEEFIWE